MSDTTGPAASEQGEVSEEQMREYVEQLRSAPAEQIVTELLSVLLNASQAKVGRRDARLLIDLSAVLVDQVRPHVSAELTTQVDQVLEQLRRGQVQAEEAVGSGPAEPNDLAEPPASAGGATGEQSQPPPSGRPSSGLWVPGRDQ